MQCLEDTFVHGRRTSAEEMTATRTPIPQTRRRKRRPAAQAEQAQGADERPKQTPRPPLPVAEAEWLREAMQRTLRSEGLDDESSAKVGEACAHACRKLLGAGGGGFDPLILMDELEEEIERRGLRGDFLPMELGQKGARLLNQRWNGPLGPSRYERVARENKLDVFNLASLPPIPQPPSAAQQPGMAPTQSSADVSSAPPQGEQILDADEDVIR